MTFEHVEGTKHISVSLLQTWNFEHIFDHVSFVLIIHNVHGLTLAPVLIYPQRTPRARAAAPSCCPWPRSCWCSSPPPCRCVSASRSSLIPRSTYVKHFPFENIRLYKSMKELLFSVSEDCELGEPKARGYFSFFPALITTRRLI